MLTIFVSGNDTNAGKTHVLGQIAGTLAAKKFRVQIVKLVETGIANDNAPGDANKALAAAKKIARGNAEFLSAFRLERFSQPLAPTEAARRDGKIFSIEKLKNKISELPKCDFRFIEGAGGLAVPVDDFGNDWADFSREIADKTLIVVENRLGAICQARFISAFCAAKDVPKPLFWLNEIREQSEGVLASNQLEISKIGVPVVGESFHGGEKFSVLKIEKFFSENSDSSVPENENFENKNFRGNAKFPLLYKKFSEVVSLNRERKISAENENENLIDLSSNNYLSLGNADEICAGAISAVEKFGASSSASPLISGYKKIHAELEKTLCDWLGFEFGLVWNSGFTANSCIFSTLPQRGDLIFADRLIHNSVIAGTLKSSAKFQRFRHNDVAHLRALLEKNARQKNFSGTIFVVTESVFSMDGDSPNFEEFTALKDDFDFVWIVDEAHATGWFGENGGGKIDELNLAKKVDILVGTLGKSLGSAGAYTLFHDEIFRKILINFGPEFIFSTFLPPSAAGAALAAIRKVQNFTKSERENLLSLSGKWRSRLQKIVPEIPNGNSPVIPIPIGSESDAMKISALLQERGFRVGAIRPPTVPAGTSRLRISLNRNLGNADLENFESALKAALTKVFGSAS